MLITLPVLLLAIYYYLSSLDNISNALLCVEKIFFVRCLSTSYTPNTDLSTPLYLKVTTPIDISILKQHKKT